MKARINIIPMAIIIFIMLSLGSTVTVSQQHSNDRDGGVEIIDPIGQPGRNQMIRQAAVTFELLSLLFIFGFVGFFFIKYLKQRKRKMFRHQSAKQEFKSSILFGLLATLLSVGILFIIDCSLNVFGFAGVIHTFIKNNDFGIVYSLFGGNIGNFYISHIIVVIVLYLLIFLSVFGIETAIRMIVIKRGKKND